MSTDYEDASILEIMVLRSLQHKAEDFEQADRPPLPSFHEIETKLNTPSGDSLGEFMGHMWEAVDEWVYDNFPQFRYEEDTDGD
jgi:hypothetical protein